MPNKPKKNLVVTWMADWIAESLDAINKTQESASRAIKWRGKPLGLRTFHRYARGEIPDFATAKCICQYFIEERKKHRSSPPDTEDREIEQRLLALSLASKVLQVREEKRKDVTRLAFTTPGDAVLFTEVPRTTILDKIATDAKDCALIALYGPPGRGKTTVLEQLAQRAEPSNGDGYSLIFGFTFKTETAADFFGSLSVFLNEIHSQSLAASDPNVTAERIGQVIGITGGLVLLDGIESVQTINGAPGDESAKSRPINHKEICDLITSAVNANRYSNKQLTFILTSYWPLDKTGLGKQVKVSNYCLPTLSAAEAAAVLRGVTYYNRSLIIDVPHAQTSHTASASRLTQRVAAEFNNEPLALVWFAMYLFRHNGGRLSRSDFRTIIQKPETTLTGKDW